MNRLDPEEVAAAFLETHLGVNPSYYLDTPTYSDHDGPCGCALGAIYMRNEGLTLERVGNHQHSLNDRVSKWATNVFGDPYHAGVNHGFAWASDHLDEDERAYRHALERYREGYWDGAMSRRLVEDALAARKAAETSTPLLVPTA